MFQVNITNTMTQIVAKTKQFTEEGSCVCTHYHLQ
jgi:hypothetical protein